ncbi:(S)-3,5-dihydroxyphenylglycine transaminase [Micromonospora sp. M71_S20]|uniref:aminotransferase-like domain-containing protein n=1 Tax=Micromonospora sp. M71_S20 TaxID=592872 RepID=UPI000F0F8C7F|nr:PLP-dependent aminotransferase family protein [Micromonospora sp. M71_S20]RLK09656.1 (S)-3,5-dihydroxyphenylglycine transaminase [Micromonospora sp. M71_S20]
MDATATLTAGTHLHADDLHRSVSSRQIAAMTFLNEIVAEFPDAISFAPGAPYEPFFADVAVGPVLDTFVEARRAAGLSEEAVRRQLFQYGPSRGIINDLVAAALRADEGIDVPPEAIVMTVGCQEALFLTLRVLHPPGASLAVTDPSYVGVVAAADSLDITVHPVPDDGTGPDLAVLRTTAERERAAGRRLRALYVSPDFANPSGNRLSLAARQRLLATASALDLMLIEDNPYAFTAASDDRLPSLKALDREGRVVHTGTFAKVAVPGARVGYVVADQWVTSRSGPPVRLAALVAAAKNAVTLNTSPLAQALIGGLLIRHGGSIAALGRRKAAHLRGNRAVLVERLAQHFGDPGRPGPGFRWWAPEGGYFVQCELPVEADDALLRYSAETFGVLWTPMRGFHLRGGGERRIRLSCSSLEPEEIVEGTARLADFVDAL